MKKILILGAGLVSRPGVRYLLKQPDISVAVASRTVSKAEKLVEGYKNGAAFPLNVKDEEKLVQFVKQSDIVVSLLPWVYHVKVAKLCLELGKDMATTSYVNDEMQALDNEVKGKKLLFLNEMGVDPGIDHMSAMKIIDDVHREEGKVLHFYSYCGGLPTPEDNDNPFGYKFSWSPKGVVLASRNSAQFLEDGDIINIDGKELFSNYRVEEIKGLGKFEVYPNRDSVPYKELYGLKDALTVMRGTYRYPGWCDTLKAIVDIGLVDDTLQENLTGKSYVEMMAEITNVTELNDVISTTAEKLGIGTDSDIIRRLEWLGLFSDDRLPDLNNYLDILCYRMQEKLFYREGEKDMIILRHKFTVENSDKSRDLITSTLIDYGIPYGDTSMARTVSLPLAIGVKLMAEGKIPLMGVHIPNVKKIYQPVLTELENLNIKMIEKKSKV